MSDDALWRKLVNSMDKMPVEGTGPPQQEMFEPENIETAIEEFVELEEDQVFVQKIVTEVYIFTDSARQIFGEHTFQDMVILGVMTREKLVRLLNRQKKKHERGS